MRPALLAFLLATVAHAQPDWSALLPAAGVAVPAADGFEAWEAGPGAAVRVEAPAYGGRARAEVVVLAYEPTGDAPAFDLLVPTLGWGAGAGLGRVRVGGGARVGAAVFRFDDPDAGNFDQEIEGVVGAWAGASVRVGRVEVWAEADATRVVLSTPTALVTASGGLAVRLGTPGWLRGVLR